LPIDLDVFLQGMPTPTGIVATCTSRGKTKRKIKMWQEMMQKWSQGRGDVKGQDAHY